MSGENQRDSEEDGDRDSESASIRERNGFFTTFFNSLISGGLLAVFVSSINYTVQFSARERSTVGK